MGQTLLLNADYTLLSINPLSTLNWQNAVKLEFTGHARPVAFYENWTVSSPSIEIEVPAVMALTEYVRFKRGVKFTLRNLFLRDNYTCQYCGNKFEAHDLSKDHVLPRKYGGGTSWKNIVTACKPCNHRRGHNVAIQPKTQPYRPNIQEIESKLLKQPVHVLHESWIPFLEGYWDKDLLIKKY